MNKEKIITVAIGLGVGILVTGGYFAFINFFPKRTQTIIVQPSPKSEKTATISGAQNLTLTLDLPEDQTSTSSSPIAVSGKTVPIAKVVFFSNADEKIASADATGNFTMTLKLEEGENEISVTAFFDKTISAVIHRNVNLEVIP